MASLLAIPGTVTSVLEGTTYHASELVPWLSTSLAVTFGVLVITFAFADRRTRSGLTIIAALAAALVTWMLIADGELVATAGELFAARYQAAYASATAGAAALCLGVVARLRQRERSLSTIGAGIIAACGALLLAAGIGNRVSLGDPFQQLPVVVPAGGWRGHAGFPHEAKAALAVPNWRLGDLLRNVRGEFTPTIAPLSEHAARGWSCENCTVKMPPEDVGAHDVAVRGRAGRITFEKAFRFTAIKELGNPLWPMRVGERHVFGLAHHARGRDGGWLTALADGNASHATPRPGAISVEHANLVITVVRTEMRDGFRHFILEISENSRVRELAVMAENNETWLAPSGRGPNVEFIRSYGRAEGLFQCAFAATAALPMFVCATGSDPRAPVAGPVTGIKSAEEIDFAEEIVNLFSLGAVISGDKSYDQYCYESATPGTGEAMGIDPAAQPAPLEPRAVPLPFAACPAER